MAKIDTSKIEGYAEMSAEDKIAALEAFEVDDPEVTKYKNAASKANSEAAEWKRKHNALLSDEDKQKQEQAEAIEKITKERDELLREKTLASHTAEFVAQGYSLELAKDTAAALIDGDFAKLFANSKVFLSERDQAAKANDMKNTPAPKAGGTTPATDYQAKANEAMLRNDYASAAAFLRMAQEAQAKNIK